MHSPGKYGVVFIPMRGTKSYSRARVFVVLRAVCIIGAALIFMTLPIRIHAQLVIVENPQSESVIAGNPVSFSVSAQGTTRLRYRWQFNGRTLPVVGRTLRFVATRRRAGTYQAIVRDAAGNIGVSRPAILDVQPRPTVQPGPGIQPPIILVQPQNVSVAEHGTAVFQVVLNKSAPYTTIVWHNSNPLEGSHQIPDGIGLNVHGTRLEIPNCLDADNYNGLYWIAVTNAAGGTVSVKARLTVIPR
jgi:hypothetical protein